jgi:rhodanese-related sulfurtransferase
MFNLFSTKKQTGFIDAGNEEFRGMLNKPETILLDTRTPAEFHGGHIPGAKLVDLFDRGLQKKLDQMDKDKIYLLYCRSGNRSAQLCKVMSKMGYSGLYNLKHGIIKWDGDISTK